MKQFTHLIPCEDFVLKVSDYVFQEASFAKDNKRFNIYSKGLSLDHSYATLLKQELNLGMFIPTDIEGNVLEKPELYIDYSDSKDQKILYELALKEYEDAEQRVLFKGFEIKNPNNHKIDTMCHTSLVTNSISCFTIGYKKDWEDFWEFEGETISDLAKHNLELTQAFNDKIFK